AALAPGVDPAAPRIPAFRAISGCARPAAGTRTLAMARPRCPAAFPALHSAATLVLRFLPPVADSENAPQHSGHRRLQLGGGPLALVSHADLYAPAISGMNAVADANRFLVV